MKLKIADQNSVPGEPGIATATLPNQILWAFPISPISAAYPAL